MRSSCKDIPSECEVCTCDLEMFLIFFRKTDHKPFVSIVKPAEYAGMDPAQVMTMLDWTNKTIRDKYQAVILEEGTPVDHACWLHDHRYSYRVSRFNQPT